MSGRQMLVPAEVEDLLSSLRDYVEAQPSPNGLLGGVQFHPSSATTGNHAPSAPLPEQNFNEAAYLYLHPDVAAAVRRGEYRSGLEHWKKYGKEEGRMLRPEGGSET